MSASDDQPEVTPEVLHTHAVALEEVLRDLESWKPSMKDELGSLLEAHNAISPITYDEVKKLEESGVNVLWVPSKIVATIKAGTGRKKIRLVACGNFLSREKTRKSPTLSRTDVFTSSLDSLSLRLQLAMASSRKWVLTSVDVKTAFLTAPIGGGRQLRTIVVKPARVLVEAGLVAPGQLFKVEKALYGLHQSPRDWSISRDTKLCALTWSVNGETRRLVQSKCDCSIWFIRRVVQDVVVTNEPPIGALGVYVDDLLLTSEESETDALLRAIRSLWTCSEEQRSTKGRVIFCGLEIDQNPETKELEIHQSSYIRALEARHGPLRSAVLPMFKDEDEEEETSLDMIREAQGLAGELTWISCRSRPDVSFSVSKIARMLSKRPSAAIKAAKQVIGYLLHTRAYCLRYGGPTDPELEGHLLRKRGMEVVETFTDASFGVESGRSQSGVVVAVGGCVVGWLSLTQPFTTLSTCESELIAACEGLTLTQALLPLWAEMLGSTPAWYAYTDSVACAAVLIYPSGNWRTKHLRLRSKVYQELVEAEELAIAHVPGRFQLADALTKPLTRVRMLELLKFAGMSNLDNEGGGQSSRTGAATPLLKVLLVGCLVGQAQAQPEYRLAGDMDSFLWFIFTVLVVVGGLIGLYLQDRRHQARLQELREMSAQALRELDQAVSKRESASGGATHEEVSLCPSKAPSIAKSPPVLSKAAPPKSQAASRSLRAVPVFGSGPCNAPPANRPDPLTSQVGRPPAQNLPLLQAVVGFLESQIHQEMSAVNTPPLEDEDSLASSEDSLDTEESAHVGWHEPEFDFDPHDPYADLPSSERGRLDPDTYDPSHVNSEDFPATLRDVLSFEGLRILSSLGISPSAWGGWYATSQSFRWAVKYAHEDLVARMSRLHIFCGPSCSRYSRANDADNLPEDGLFFSEEDDWKLEIHDFFRGNDEYAFQNVERAYHFWQKIGGYTWQLDLDVVRDGLSMSEEHGLAMLAAGQPGASSRDLRSRPRFPTCLGFYVDDVAPDLTASSSQDMPMSDHDHAMAHAAFFLYQNNITVDWEQLSEAQQDIYHSLVGAWLQGIHEVD
ncbi:RE2 [Symbiodinium natans]|uniref:RE2 protein n=1 Tax=Symbiodinium natans TaxID=878477 RepID=A0A812K1C4_9DINO|nr:RE2 [Symbiodinium natans]